MSTKLKAYKHSWPLREPFVISRGTQTDAEVIMVELGREGCVGRGEAMGVGYHGETLDGMLAQIETVRSAIEAGVGRFELLDLLPRGGARNAVDCAMWDLEAKLSGHSVWRTAGVSANPVVSAITIGMRSLDAAAQRAREVSAYPWIKIKVAADQIVATVEAVRNGAPNAKLIVDANQAWTIATLREVAGDLHSLNVNLIEQPLRVGQDAELSNYRCPIPLCADESLNAPEDIPTLVGRYQYVNIKLDKTGGLTAALELADRAQSSGLDLMVGCMLGSSIAMAPGMVLAQRCKVVDLDAPLLQAGDVQHGIVYENGTMTPFTSALWG